MSVIRKTITFILSGNRLIPSNTDAGVQGENNAVQLQFTVPADWEGLAVNLYAVADNGAQDEATAVSGVVTLPLQQGLLADTKQLRVHVEGVNGADVRKTSDCLLTVQKSSTGAIAVDPISPTIMQDFQTKLEESGGDMYKHVYANGSGSANGFEVDHSKYADASPADSVIAAHAARTDNPHGVTAAQVKADPEGTAAAVVTTHNADTNTTAHAGLFALKLNIADLGSGVLATVAAGLSTATNAVITATDTVLSALGKLQAQITANLSTLTSHTSNTSNPHSVTASQVGLGNVNNTADADKPISTAMQTALNAKASASSLATVATSGKYSDLTGTPTIPTTTDGLTEGTTNQYFTTARAQAAISGTSPISVSSGVVSIQAATDSQAGYLTAADHTTFSGKASNTVFGASGSSHASGLVPDPGSTAGTTKYLREDGSWVVPAGSGTGTVTEVKSTSGDISVSNGTAVPDLSLPASGVTAGSYTSANITVDAKGRVTSASNGSGGSSYTLPAATASTLGGVKVGSGLSIADGVLSGFDSTIYTGTVSSNAITATISNYTVGKPFFIQLSAAVTAACTLSVNGGTAYSIVDRDGTVVTSAAANAVLMLYQPTSTSNFQLF